jgi:carbonic anhydrase
MCDCNTTRRGLMGLAAGAAGFSLLPNSANAATVTALGITCIDYRLVEDEVHFFHGKHLSKDYDEVALAGASLAAVSDKFPSSNAAFWDHIAIAKALHHIRRVIVVDHRDCGAYKVAFGKDYQGEHAAETVQHKSVMEQVKAKLAKLHPELESEFYLMALDGKAERVL